MIPLTTPPGTKVRVREDAKSNADLLFLDWMNQYRGKVLTIKAFDTHFRVDECWWVFHPSWLDLVEEPMNEPKRVANIDGELWFLFGSILQQGAAIQLDHQSGRYKNYEEFAQRMSCAASELVKDERWLRIRQAIADAEAGK